MDRITFTQALIKIAETYDFTVEVSYRRILRLMNCLREFIAQTGFQLTHNEFGTAMMVSLRRRRKDDDHRTEYPWEFPDGYVVLHNSKLIVAHATGPWLELTHDSTNKMFVLYVHLECGNRPVGYCSDPEVFIGRLLGSGFKPEEAAPREWDREIPEGAVVLDDQQCSSTNPPVISITGEGFTTI